MTYTPRYYQQEAHDAAIEHMTKSLEPQVLSLPCGAGKSLVISMIAHTINKKTGKKVLVTAPSAKLCVQNRDKYLSYGERASMFSASAGRKELRHDVIFGTTLTLLNSKDKLEGIGLIICDEAHGITKSLKDLINYLREVNPQLRVLGLTATPYRAGMGHIYEAHYKHGFIDSTYKPYFKKCTYEIHTRELIEKGFLTNVVNGVTSLHYDTDKLVKDKKGKWTEDSLNTVFLSGKERLTSEIVKYVVEITENYNSVMFFGATIQHCEEIMLSLPSELSRMITGSTQNRAKIERDFEKMRFKYLVSVATQLTGVDYPGVDCLAVLRKTESLNLFQQLIGRGTRLYQGKESCLLLDFAGNEKNYVGTDLFAVDVNSKSDSESDKITAICPECSHENQFAERPNDAGYFVTENGYFSWPDTGDIVLDNEKRPVPAHYGRRCKGLVTRVDRCRYKWTFKLCEKCEHENDIAARYCSKCKCEIIDPNEKLELDRVAEKRLIDERHITEPVLTITIDYNFKGDNRIKVVTFETIFRKRIREFLRMSNEKERDKFRQYRSLNTDNLMIEFFKPTGKQFYKTVGFTYENM